MISIGKECTGCGLCSVVCPEDAISMHENEEGFLYPVIEKIDAMNAVGVYRYVRMLRTNGTIRTENRQLRPVRQRMKSG